MNDAVDTSKEAVQHALYLLECGEHHDQHEEQRNFILALAAERDQLRREVEEARDKALEEAQNVVLQQIGEDKNGFRIWADERPYVCEETVYRSIRALKARP